MREKTGFLYCLYCINNTRAVVHFTSTAVLKSIIKILDLEWLRYRSVSLPQLRKGINHKSLLSLPLPYAALPVLLVVSVGAHFLPIGKLY